MSAVAISWFEFLLLPPGVLTVFLVLALLVYRKRKPLAVSLLVIGSLLTLVLAMPVVARSLITSLQTHPPLNFATLPEPDAAESSIAIVVLGGGRYAAAPEYDQQDQISQSTLERLRYAARLSRELRWPLLLSGGRRNADATPEAVMMNQVLVEDYDIYPVYLEVNAQNTHEQAEEVSTILRENQIEQALIITHAWHMPRALAEFAYQGIKAIPAPMGFAATAQQQIDYLPSAAAMAISSRALHEYYALFWLNLLHQSQQTPHAKAAAPEQNSAPETYQ